MAWYLQRRGHVERQGTYIPYANINKLDRIGDVYIPTPTNGDVPTWNSTTRRWEGLAGAAATGVNTLNDVTIDGTPADNEVLAYDTGTSQWINQTAAEAGLATSAHTHVLDDLTDVTITSPATNALLQYNGSAWIDVALADVVPQSAYLSMNSNEDSAASAAEYDVFDQDNYGGTMDNQQHLTASGITWTPADGRFTVTNAGIYQVVAVLNLVKATAANTVTCNVNKTGVLYFSKSPLVGTVADTTFITIPLIVSMAASDYLNFTVNSDDANTVQAEDGTRLTIARIS